MKKVLAIRTPDGHYIEFDTVRAQTDAGEIVVDLSEAVFAQVITVPEAAQRPSQASRQNGRKTIVIDGVGGIESEEVVKG